MEGRKDDSQKVRYTLMPEGVIQGVLEVLEFGAKKYDVDNWQKVPDGEVRYMNAAWRHFDAHARGELTDPESGLPHLDHAICSLAFARWFSVPRETKRDPSAVVEDIPEEQNEL